MENVSRMSRHACVCTLFGCAHTFYAVSVKHCLHQFVRFCLKLFVVWIVELGCLVVVLDDRVCGGAEQ